MAKMMTDNYTSQAVFYVAESAANTLTFEKLETGLSVYDKIGWVVQRVEWMLSPASYSFFNGANDYINLALTITNSLTALGDENPAIIAIERYIRNDFGTAANAQLWAPKIVQDFTGLSGGGLLTLPNPIYCGVQGSGLSAAAAVICRLYFKAIELSDTDYFNLVQSRQLLIST